jgi:glycosyltransferase involved in cell wall biosynthesis
MRICSPQLGLSPSSGRGGEVYDVEVLTRLAQAGVEVDVLLPAGLPAPTQENLRITRLPLRRGYRWFVSNLYLVPYLGYHYRQRPFDLLRVHSLRFTGLAALWARRTFRLPVPILAHHHHTDPDRWTLPIDARVVHAVDKVVVPSQATQADTLARFGVSPGRVAVVPSGIGERFRPGLPATTADAQEPGAQDRPLVLHVGSLIPRKDVAGLLTAFAAVTTALPQARLVLIGGGPEEGNLRRLAEELGIAHCIEFAGRIAEEAKLAYYAEASLLVSASLMEGFGLAVGEAMACGIPVVATHVGSIPELVQDGVTGLLVPPQDPVALANAMLRLLQDRTLATRFGTAGAARIDNHFRWPRAIEHSIEIYRELIAACTAP